MEAGQGVFYGFSFRVFLETDLLQYEWKFNNTQRLGLTAIMNSNNRSIYIRISVRY